ncbi:hypothetical protein [Variovorax paradoxus]|uniref:hypothetical protein n=1 Tax=Variovorax paradoxus TaxID=34073 RepID=UPI003ECCD9B7
MSFWNAAQSRYFEQADLASFEKAKLKFYQQHFARSRTLDLKQGVKILARTQISFRGEAAIFMGQIETEGVEAQVRFLLPPQSRVA